MSKINVLSLFDGMSCAQIAINRAGINYEKYYSSEVYDKSIYITNKNYPNTIQLGDVRDIDEYVINKIDNIDLMIFGFPCKNLSRTVINNPNHNQGLKGSQSSLFYEAIRIMNIVKPKYFLVENVESMKDEDRDIISKCLKVEPIMIDSSLFSAQSRKRYYWTNISFNKDVKNNDFKIVDIIENDVDEKYWYKCDFKYNGKNEGQVAELDINGHDIMKRVYGIYGKCPTLTAVVGGNQQKKIYYNGRCRKLTPTEYEKLQTVPVGYTKGVSDTHRYRMLGDGFTVDVIAHILKGLKE